MHGISQLSKWLVLKRLSVAGSGRPMTMAKLGTLEMHPKRCAIADESSDVGTEIRELLFGRLRYKYRILFRITEESVVILRIWHGSRDSITREYLPE